MRAFVLGVLASLCAVTALFFLRYWRASGDRLFGFFAVGFLALAMEWLAHALFDAHLRQDIYLVRLLAFGIIILGIVDKNRRSSRA